MTEPYLVCETEKDFDEIYKECKDDARYEIEIEVQKDMLWASRTTGMPDMFGPEMNWFWAGMI